MKEIIYHQTPKLYERYKRRIVFVYNNMDLLLKLDKLRKEKKWAAFTLKNPLVKKIANKARQYIGYSNKTYDADICWTLYMMALDLHRENIKYQLINN